MKILVAGDSFSSDKLAGECGWPAQLAQAHSVTNVSQPGAGEFKILRQLELQNLTDFDLVIVSHTSPNRVHAETNPLYPSGHVYRNSDILFGDVESKVSKDPVARSMFDYFTQVFDIEYYHFVHTCCCERIDQLTKDYNVIHMTNFEWTHLYPFDPLFNFYNLWLEYPGEYAHLNRHGANKVAQILKQRIDYFESLM